jgi:hypothetical protein
MSAADRAREAWNVEPDLARLSEMIAVPLSLEDRDRLLEIGTRLCKAEVTDGGAFLLSLVMRWDVANLATGGAA